MKSIEGSTVISQYRECKRTFRKYGRQPEHLAEIDDDRRARTLPEISGSKWSEERGAGALDKNIGGKLLLLLHDYRALELATLFAVISQRGLGHRRWRVHLYYANARL